MKVTTYITKFLDSKGINTIFELQGGMITRIIDEMHRHGNFSIVSMHHEQAAAFAADAFARVTKKPGIAMATSGPGATNLITGIGGCYFDSVPAIFFTGQVNISEQKGEKETRQIGFQETDIVPIVKPITKAAFSIKHANEIPQILNDAYNIASEGRPGPVLIDIPMNIQDMNIEIEQIELENKIESQINKNRKAELEKFHNDFLSDLKIAVKPLVLIGHGVRTSGSKDKLLRFIEKYNLPVVTSLLGLDNVSYKNPNRIGFIGTYGNRWANYALGNCDLLLVLGSRLDLRQTGSDTTSFQKNKKIYHIDIDPAELNNRFSGCRTIAADIKEYFEYALLNEYEASKFQVWRDEIEEKRNLKKDIDELEVINGINPNKFIHKLCNASKRVKIFTTDVGNNQMWAAQSVELEDDQLFLSSGGMGAMGYSLPAAIGASFSLKNLPVVCIAGDGGFQINIQELQTIRRNNLPIKIVILNNQCLGMIRQFQDAYFNSCYQSTVWGYNSPDFVKVAKAYEIDAFTITDESEIDIGLKKLWNHPEKPFLLNVMLDIHTNVFPKMMYGNPITKMEPLLNSY